MFMFVTQPLSCHWHCTMHAGLSRGRPEFDSSRHQLLLPGPKSLILDRYYFHPRVYVCVCVSVSLFPDYLKKFLTDFDEIWQDDV